MFNSTFEIPLNLSNSVIVQPAVWLGSSDGYITVFDDGVEYEKLIRVGSGIGMRRYVRDRSQGFYVQAIASLYYISAKSISSREEGYEENYDCGYGGCYSNLDSKITIWKKVKGVTADLVFYIGAAHKWQNIGFFYEGGLGFGYDGTKTYQISYKNSLVASFNLGVGIPF